MCSICYILYINLLLQEDAYYCLRVLGAELLLGNHYWFLFYLSLWQTVFAFCLARIWQCFWICNWRTLVLFWWRGYYVILRRYVCFRTYDVTSFQDGCSRRTLLLLGDRCYIIPYKGSLVLPSWGTLYISSSSSVL